MSLPNVIQADCDRLADVGSAALEDHAGTGPTGPSKLSNGAAM